MTDEFKSGTGRAQQETHSQMEAPRPEPSGNEADGPRVAPPALRTEKVLSYYDVLEVYLTLARTGYGDYFTHFGLMDQPPADYCYARCAAFPDAAAAAIITEGGDRLHRAIFESPGYEGQPDLVLDVGCGAGGTLKTLAERWPNARLHGININPRQANLARFATRSTPSVEIHTGDFLTASFQQRFDLIYFFESCFHIADKGSLLAQTASLLTVGGDVIIIDVFLSDRLSGRHESSRYMNHPQFHYLGLDQWMDLAASHGLTMYSFEDLSRPVASFITIRTPREVFLEEVVRPLASGRPDADAVVEQMGVVHDEYTRLRELLRRGHLRYGILRLRGATDCDN